MNKNIFFPVIVTVVVIGCLIAVNANFGVLKKNLDLERYNRLKAEGELESAIKNTHQLEDQLSEARNKLDGIQHIVNQGQETASQLKTSVEAAGKENETLKATIKKLQDDLAESQKAAQEAAERAAAINAPAAQPQATPSEAAIK